MGAACPVDRGGMMKRFEVAVIFLVLALFWYWTTTPGYYLAAVQLMEKKGEESGIWLWKGLVACGERSIDPVIEAITVHSPWTRNYAYLPRVLADLGEVAKTRLEAAIRRENRPMQKLYLIYALFHGFGDNSFNEVAFEIIDTMESPSLKHRFSQ